MAEELGTRDVVEQLDARLHNLEQGQRDLRSEIVTRFGQMDSRFAQLDSRFPQLDNRLDQLRSEMDTRFGRLTALMVTVLLALVVGVGGLWLR